MNTAALRRAAGILGLALALVWGGLLVLPTLYRTVDDAWISFRYAANLADGLGLVWDARPPAVEGYSNLTWTLVIAVGLSLGAPLLPWMWGCAATAFAGAILASAGIVRAAGGSRPAMVGAALLVASSAVLRPWALTGLETPLMALLLTTGTWLLLRRDTRAAAVVWGLVAVTRPEGVLYLLIPAVVWARTRVRSPGMALAVLPLLGQLLFRQITYGTWIANTGVAKLAWGSDPYRLEGWRYLLAACTYSPLTTVLVGIGVALCFASRARLALLPLAPAAVFVLVANGDTFAELRLFAPIVPCVAAGVVGVLDTWVRRSGRMFVPAAAGVTLFVTGVAGSEAWLLRMERRSGGPGPEISLAGRLAAPWVETRTRAEAGAGQRDLLRTPSGALTDIDWFVRVLIERLPRGGTFVFEDIGLVGYLLRDARLLDARGLTWPEAARVVTLPFIPGVALSEIADVRTFRETFAAEAPALVLLVCPKEGRTRMEELLLDDPAFASGWSLTARGPHFSGHAEVCVYTHQGFRDAASEVGVERYSRLERDLPGYYDWTALRMALESGVADDPSTAWRVGPDGQPLSAPPAGGRRGRGGRGGQGEGQPGMGAFTPPGTGEAERLKRRRARGLPD